MISLLEPLFQGEFAAYGEGLQCAAEVPLGAVRLAELLRSPAALADALHLYARHLGAEVRDLRPVASAWSMRYLATLLPPWVAGASVLQHGFPVATEQIWVHLDVNGVPVRFHVRHLGESVQGADVAKRYGSLLWQHLEPLFARLSGLTQLAPRILWGNAARQLESVLEQAIALTGGAASIVRDREHLLHAPNWRLGAASAQVTRCNPLSGSRREIPGRIGNDLPLRLHRQCCLLHLLPGESYCGACPLAPQHRKVKDAEADA